MFAYRICTGNSLWRVRSFCPNCNINLAWYDLIPVISWIFLLSKCRNCSKKISFLYPFIEILSVIIFYLGTIFIPVDFWLCYFIFFSCLLVTIRTDLEFLLISSLLTLYLAPLAWVLSFLDLSGITFFESVLGFFLGYFSLYIVKQLFFKLKNIEGVGQGDLELLAFIGAFLGPLGVLLSSLIGSSLGSLLGIGLIIFKKADRATHLPFGAFLAIGGLVTSLIIQQAHLVQLLFYYLG